jgi:hypothetical protein
MNREDRAIHHAADKIEPRLAKAIVLSMERLKRQIPFRQIEDALEQKDLRQVKRLLSEVDYIDVCLPSAEIILDTVIKGGKVSDEEIRGV